ncbi:MAG: nickel transporter [Acuticoccus sp.]
MPAEAAPAASQSPLRVRARVWLSVAAALGAFLALAVALSSGLGLVDMARWAATQQRAFHQMVSQLLALEGGSLAASGALIGACLAYGFIHAAIPGHGKFLIAGAGLASRISMTRLVLLSLAASLMQAVTAIALVYGSFALLHITAGWAMAATDKVLVPLSYLAIAGIAVILIRRAIKGLKALAPGGGTRRHHDHADHHHHHHHHHDGACGCNHRHAPTMEEVDALRSWRDAAMLILGIGLRPCTGAVFVLVAAWRIGLLWVGAGAAVAMALGTGAFISLVAVSAASARGATLFAAGASRARVLVPLLQLAAGVAILLIAIAFLVASLLPF